MTRKARLLLGTLALLSAGAVGAQSGAPIKVGMIASQSGGFIQPDPPKIVKAYFDRVNAQGGIGGRPLQLFVEDDKTNPQASSQAARRLVDDIGVVANVGSTSALECGVNGALYVQRGLVSIQGTGVDPTCFRNPNIAPVNTGPFTATTLALQYAAQNLGKTKICAVFTQLPGLEPAYRDAVTEFERITGKKITLQDYSYKPGDEPTPFILKTRQAGCEAVLFAGSDAFSIPWMNAVKAQGLDRSMRWLFIGATYTAAFAKAMGSSANGAIVTSEFEPWLGNSPALADWRSLSAKNKIGLSGFSLGSYLAARIFVDTLKTIKGDINRQSVTQAFKTMRPYNTGIIGTPFTFGSAASHRPNQSVKVMELRDGAFRQVLPGWLKLGAAR